MNNFKNYVKNTINKLNKKNLTLREEFNQVSNVNETNLFDEFLKEFINTNPEDIKVSNSDYGYRDFWLNDKHYILVIEPTILGLIITKEFNTGLYIYNFEGDYNYLRADLVVPIYIKKGIFNKKARNFELLKKILYNIYRLKYNNKYLEDNIDKIKKKYNEIKYLGNVNIK